MGLRDRIIEAIDGVIGGFNKAQDDRFFTEKFIQNHPEFGVRSPTGVKIIPVDGDKERMAAYGLYAGDKIVVRDKEHTIEKDEKPRMQFPKNRNGQNGFCYNLPRDGDCAIVQPIMYTHRIYHRIDEDLNGKEHHITWSNITATCIDKKTPIRDLHIMDSIGRYPVTHIDLKGCRNITHIAYLPVNLMRPDIFAETSVTELPDNIKEMEKLPRVTSKHGLGDVQTTPNYLAYYLGIYAAVTNTKEIIEIEMQPFYHVAEREQEYINRAIKTLEDIKQEKATAESTRLKVQDFIEGKASDIEGCAIVTFEKDGQFKKAGLFIIDGTQYIYSADTHQLIPSTSKEISKLGNVISINEDVQKSDMHFVIEEISSDIKHIDTRIEAQENKIANMRNKIETYVDNKRKEITAEVETKIAPFNRGKSVADSVLDERAGEIEPEQGTRESSQETPERPETPNTDETPGLD